VRGPSTAETQAATLGISTHEYLARTNDKDLVIGTRYRATLDDAAQKRGLELVWFSTGKDDFLIETTKATVAMLEKHGFDVTYEESSGGHTWINWREYLNKFAPQLFR